MENVLEFLFGENKVRLSVVEKREYQWLKDL